MCKRSLTLRWIRLELDHLALLPLVAAKLEALAPLERLLRAVLALDALKTDHDLLGGLGLLVEHRLGLATEPGLLAVITPLACVGQKEERVRRLRSDTIENFGLRAKDALSKARSARGGVPPMSRVRPREPRAC